MRRPSVPGTSRPGDFAGTAVARDALCAAAACTSDARISPPGPEPRTVAMSTPNSFARRRAFGEILAPGAAVGSEGLAGAGAASVFAWEPARAVGTAVAD